MNTSGVYDEVRNHVCDVRLLLVLNLCRDQEDSCLMYVRCVYLCIVVSCYVFMVLVLID
jgi:hypothetical protein